MPRYAVLWIGLTVVAVVAFTAVRHWPLVVDLVIQGDLPLASRLHVIVALLPVGGGFARSPTWILPLGGGVAVDATLLTYHLREHDVEPVSGAGPSGIAGSLGAVIGALGAGCAVCGTSLLAGLASLAGVSGTALALPFEGVGLAVVSGVLVVLSTYWLAAGMQAGIQKRRER
ncbi:MAG: hypothetical protein ABEJ31_09275 [Haloarculaceae archaeon]